jgi:hypothetical protein
MLSKESHGDGSSGQLVRSPDTGSVKTQLVDSLSEDISIQDLSMQETPFTHPESEDTYSLEFPWIRPPTPGSLNQATILQYLQTNIP